MPPRWNAWTHMQAVQFDHENEAKLRRVRLTREPMAVGDRVRIRMSGVEVEAVITDLSTPVLCVKVKPTLLRAMLVKRARRA